jgi:hypothetical protein
MYKTHTWNVIFEDEFLKIDFIKLPLDCISVCVVLVNVKAKLSRLL